MKRIEITNYEKNRVDVDFEDTRILVNLTLTLGDVPKLHEIIDALTDKSDLKSAALVNPETIYPEQAKLIGVKINPFTDGFNCDRYERVHYAHPNMKKGCAGCKFNRFTYCVASSKQLEENKRQ